LSSSGQGGYLKRPPFGNRSATSARRLRRPYLSGPKPNWGLAPDFAELEEAVSADYFNSTVAPAFLSTPKPG